MAHDPRRTLARPDLAASYLEGAVDARRFDMPEPRMVQVPVLNLRAAPDANGLATQLLYGEVFDMLDEADGLAWGQARFDGYVGYVDASGLGPLEDSAQVVTALAAPIYPEPDFKTTPVCHLPWQSRVPVLSEGPFRRVAQGYICAQHLLPKAEDWVDQAARLIGVPYLWGGRSSFGLDCSALVQLALMSSGSDAPRDSDMQEAELGTRLDPDMPHRRGDLIFWKGHVGIMEDETILLHANIHHMCVAREPLAEAIARIFANVGGLVTSHKRLN